VHGAISHLQEVDVAGDAPGAAARRQQSYAVLVLKRGDVGRVEPDGPLGAYRCAGRGTSWSSWRAYGDGCRERSMGNGLGKMEAKVTNFGRQGDGFLDMQRVADTGLRVAT
jgi:hypothetical protein